MPNLFALITADSTPMKRELIAVQRMAQQAGVNIQQGLNGGGAHAKSGVINEFLVLTRELSRGNFTRVPGSLTILASRMGILKLLFKDNSSAAVILAEAWAKQSAAASLASVAATRKAAASAAAFAADQSNTDATLEQAVADEYGAAAAIDNAKATEAKAVASKEAALAQGEGAAISAGPLGIVLGIVAALGVGLYFAYQQAKSLTSALSGLVMPDFHPEYIARHLQAANQSAEAQKEINREVQKTIELYNSASKAAERVSDATKEHFDHLRKMNEYERDPKKKSARDLDINKQEREAQLGNKINEQGNLERESKSKKAQADAIKVNSKEHDEELLKQRKGEAEAAQKFLDEKEKNGGFAEGERGTRVRNQMARMMGAGLIGGMSDKELQEGYKAKDKEAHEKVAAYKQTVEMAAANEEARKKKSELDKAAGQSASKAAEIGAGIKDGRKTIDQKNKDEADEEAARLSGERGKVTHGTVNSLQQIGAYAQSASMLDVARKSEQHLAAIHHAIVGKGKTGASEGSFG